MQTYLSTTEHLVLNLLYRGKNYTEIAVHLRKSLPNVLTTSWRIRQKTGIQDTANVDEVRKWVKNNQLTLKQSERGPTPAEREVLFLLGQGLSYSTIATMRGVSNQCVVNQACSGRSRACIEDTLPSTIRAWFAKEKEREEHLRSTLVHPPATDYSQPLNGNPCF